MSTVKKNPSHLLLKNSFILLTLLMSSCSHLKIKREIDKKEEINLSLRKVCLAGEGRGEFFDGKVRKQAPFESVWNFERREWGAAFSIPFYGEESLFINYGIRNHSGTIWKKRKNIRSTRFFAQIFSDFLAFLHDFYFKQNAMISICQIENELEDDKVIKAKCSYQKNGFTIQLADKGNLTIYQNLGDFVFFEAKGTQENYFEDFYDSFSLRLYDKKKEIEYWHMEIFLSKCSQFGHD